MGILNTNYALRSTKNHPPEDPVPAVFMLNSPEPFAPFESELLVATCSPQGELIAANEAWQGFLGTTTEAWTNLSPEDQALVRHKDISRHPVQQIKLISA